MTADSSERAADLEAVHLRMLSRCKSRVDFYRSMASKPGASRSWELRLNVAELIYDDLSAIAFPK